METRDIAIIFGIIAGIVGVGSFLGFIIYPLYHDVGDKNNYPMPTPTSSTTPTSIVTPINTPIPTSTIMSATPTVSATSPPLPVGSWQKIDDLPRQVNTLVVDPTNSQVLYAGTGDSGSGSGVYKSEDAGLTWHLASQELPSVDMESLAFSHVSPTLYAAANSGDIFASTNGAEHWTQLGNTELMGSENCLVVAPSDGNVLFIVKGVRGVACSRDGGITWQPISKGLPKNEDGYVYAQSLAIVPTDANVVYLGTGLRSSNGNGVYKSIDGGTTWSSSNKGMLDFGITALAVNPVNPQIVYAGEYGGKLFKSTNGGTTWSDLSAQLFDQKIVRDIAIDPTNPEKIYLLCERVGILISNDGGVNWSVLGKPVEPDYPSFTAMTILFNSQPVLIVGISGEGGWRYAAEG